MARYTWVGGGDNLVTDPADWSPNHAPVAGDTLDVLPDATISVAGSAIDGNTLWLQGNGTSSPAGTDTINVTGTATFNVANNDDSPGHDQVVVNLAAQSKWIGGFSNIDAYGEGAEVHGTGCFTNTATVIDNILVVDAGVRGTGSFVEEEGHRSASIEFTKSVSVGQTVDIEGNAAYGGQYGSVQVDQPKYFHASITLGFGELVLNEQATSYTYQNNLLTLYSGNTAVDTLHLTLSKATFNGPQDFGVALVGSKVVVHADGTNVHALA